MFIPFRYCNYILFIFLQDACKRFSESIAQLDPAEAARVGSDPGGSRVLEAFIVGEAPAKLKRKLVRSLRGHYGAVASRPGGSHVVEKIFNWAVRTLTPFSQLNSQIILLILLFLVPSTVKFSTVVVFEGKGGG